MADVMGVTVSKTYTRNSTKDLLVLRNKIAKCIIKAANELGYEVHTIINDNGSAEKSLTINITKIEV